MSILARRHMESVMASYHPSEETQEGPRLMKGLQGGDLKT